MEEIQKIDDEIRNLLLRKEHMREEVAKKETRLNNCWTELENSKAEVCVVYYVNVDCDYPKNTKVKILGVFSDETEARRVSDSVNTYHPYDGRCCWTETKRILLNKETEDDQEE